MEQLLTGHVARNLYWLGRYLERIETTLHKVMRTCDKIIDVDKDAGKKFFQKFDIQLEYSDSQTYINEAIAGEHHANLINIMHQARENAIIARQYINTEAFGEIIELGKLFKSLSKTHPDLDYKFIDHAHSLLSEIHGELSTRTYRQNSDYFVKLGTLIEEADFYIRFDKDKSMTDAILEEIDAIVHILAPDLELPDRTDMSQDVLLTHVNAILETIIIEA